MSSTVCKVANLVSLVYVSSSLRPLSDAEIHALLRAARLKNDRRQITGMLLYKDANFLQVIEGPESEVDELLQALKEDDRHRGLIILTKKTIAERQFPNWSMAFRDLATLSDEDKGAFSPFLKQSFLDEEFRQRPESSYKLLLHFKESCR